MINAIPIFCLSQNFCWPRPWLRQGNNAKTLTPTQLSSWRSIKELGRHDGHTAHSVTPANSEALKRERTCKTFWTAVTSVWLTSHWFHANSQNWQGDCHLNHPDSKCTIRGYNHKKEYCFRVLWETVYFSYLLWVVLRSFVIQQYTIYLSPNCTLEILT